ncbi:MAG: Rne/Rng family ribonuclease [Elusimicrobia bacterium]|nr:Rne/Rng family ribonuclease [Elusimicrobiota bacterium]
MPNEIDSTQTPQEPARDVAAVTPAEAAPAPAAPPRLERVHDGSTPGVVEKRPEPAAAPVAPPIPASVAALALDVSDESEDDGDDESEVPPPSSGPAASAPATADAPGALNGGQNRQPGEGGRRRRRRRRGRGGRERRDAAAGAPPVDPAAPRPETPNGTPPPSATPTSSTQTPVPSPESTPRPEAGRSEDRRDQNRGREARREDRREDRGQERREDRRAESGEGRREERRDRREERHDRHERHERHGHGAERTNEVRGARPPVKREVLANTSFEETRVAIMENGRLAELHWERRSSQNIVGNIYKGTVENVLPGISSAFVNIGFEKNAYLYISDVLGDKGAAIDSTLKKGQTIMVQVAKEAISTKGPKVTMDVTLPGRYLVFTPFQSDIGISKHIAEQEERDRLDKIVRRLVAEKLGGKGVVVRTEAEGATEEELEREVKYLLEAWQKIEKGFADAPPPALLHQDLNLALQVARDVMSEQVYVYMIDNKDAFAEVLRFVEGFAPELKDRVRLYESKTPIFKAFNIEREIASIRETKVPLPNGGSIVIQEAESLCAIDVNTGRFTGSKSQEETVTQTNIEAALMVAQQLRLRNIGGIIVVDFIDMRKASNRQKVMETFAEACRADRAKIRILPITRLGLIELTRERKRMSTAALLTADCPQCRASGRVLSTETLRIKIQREIFEMTGGRPGGSIRVLLHPSVSEAFRSQQATIEKNVQRSIKIQNDPQLMWEDYRIILE